MVTIRQQTSLASHYLPVKIMCKMCTAHHILYIDKGKALYELGARRLLKNSV